MATLVAHGAQPRSLFAVVAEQVAGVLHVPAVSIVRYEADGTATEYASFSARGELFPVGTRWSLSGTNVVARVLESGRPARIDDYSGLAGVIAETARRAGIHSTVGIPIVVAGRLWGAMVTSSTALEPLPEGTEARLADFTELVATAISNSEARAEVERLAEEQAALRRVATLVAQGVPPGQLFDAVAEEVGRLFGADLTGMIRYETGGTVTATATWTAVGEHPDVSGRWPLEGDRLATTIARTRRSAREDAWPDVPGPIAELVRERLGVRSSVGSPVVVEGRVWGALFVHSKTEPLRADTESRLQNFTELLATAMANVQARAEVDRLADEQAALRRVATLVARESRPAEIFAAVADDVARLLGVDITQIYRYEADGTATTVAGGGDRQSIIPDGTRVTLEGENLAGLVRRTGRSARIDDYATASGSLGKLARRLGIRAGVGTPIVVEGRIWGAMCAVTKLPAPLPPDAGSRMGEFTELVATAISNIHTRSELAASRARIVAATDQERRRVVRDLHDGAQQRLVHTVVTLKLARRALQEDASAAPAFVDEALDQAQHATVELRELAHGILPSVLTGGGLHAGVAALASRMPMPVENRVAVGRLPPAVEATAYFVVAEALTNVAKHSGATHAAVMARIEDGTLRVHVRDDGVGGARPYGSGLLGLADRLAVLDGRLDVESPADGGTLVAAAIPVAG